MAVRLIKPYTWNMDVKTGKVTTTAKLYADTKEELVKETMHVEGLPDGNYDLKAGSEAYTPNGDIAILDSQDNWNWIGENS